MLMTLGPFVFWRATLPYQSLRRTTDWRHPTQTRIGARAATQFLGDGQDTIDLSGTLMPAFTGGQVSLDLVRALAGSGRSWPLIEGTGRLLGMYIITGVEETSTLTMSNGAPQQIEFTLKLLRTDNWAAIVGAAIGAQVGGLAGLLR